MYYRLGQALVYQLQKQGNLGQRSTRNMKENESVQPGEGHG